MKVEYAEFYGFCDGVRHAVNLASKVRPPAYTLGPIVHNKRIVEGLEKKGIRAVTFEDLQEKEVPIGTVIIRAHGIPAEQSRWLTDKANMKLCRVIDATCVNVAMQYKEAPEYRKKGYALWIVEDKQPEGKAHPEILAKLSRLEGDVHRITCADDIPDEGLYGKIALIPQTTFDLQEYDSILRKLRPKAKDVQTVGAICPATHERQKAAIDLAARVDAMVVVGGGLEGRPSNNTLELAKVSKRINPRTYLVADASEINPADFEGVEVVGLTAGASTPDIVVNEVACVLKGL